MNGNNNYREKGKRNNALLIAVIVLTVVMLGVAGLLVYSIFFDDDVTSVSKKKDDDKKSDKKTVSAEYNAAWEGYEDAAFTEMLEAVPFLYDEHDLEKFTVDAASGWEKSKWLNEEDDLSEGAKAYTYETHMVVDETKWTKHIFFMELKNGVLEAKGGILVEFEDGEEYSTEEGKDAVENFLINLSVAHGQKKVIDEGIPEGTKAYGRLDFGMSMEEAKDVVGGSPEKEENQLQYFENDSFEIEDDESIIASADCKTLLLDFIDDQLTGVNLFADDLSYSEAVDVYEALMESYGDGEHEYEEDEDSEYWQGKCWWRTDNYDVYARLSYIDSESYYQWYISIEYSAN